MVETAGAGGTLTPKPPVVLFEGSYTPTRPIRSCINCLTRSLPYATPSKGASEGAERERSFGGRRSKTKTAS